MFLHTQVGEICRRQPITVLSTDTISHLLHLLSSHKISSCPVLDAQTKAFLGFVDTLDIAGYILTVWKKNSRQLEHGKFPARDFFSTPLHKVLNFSHVDPSVTMAADSSVFDLVDLFSDPRLHLRLHRVAIVDAHKQLIGIVSQSDVVAFAHRNISLLARDLALTPLKEMHIGRSLIFVRVDAPFIDTLETLYRNRITGLALVDQEFRLSGNISASDLRGISPSSFDYFLGSTLQFLVKGRKGDIVPPKAVDDETTLEEILKTFVQNKVHRLYVNDQNGRPHAVVTLGDIIARIL